MFLLLQMMIQAKQERRIKYKYMKKKIYFVCEGTVNGETVNTDKFNQIIDPKTNRQMYEDVFQITECADFEKYEQKEDFIATILGMTYNTLSIDGEVGNKIIITAVEEGTDILLWGVEVEIIDDDNFKYTTLDWKSGGHILKFEDSDTDPIVDYEELCQYIKDQLGEESKLTLKEIDAVLNLEMDYLRSKGIVAD